MFNIYRIFYYVFPPKNPTRIVFKKCKQLKYPMPNIIRALMKLNDLKNRDLIDGQTRQCNISATVSGYKQSKIVKKRIARTLKLTEDELFPLVNNNGRH